MRLQNFDKLPPIVFFFLSPRYRWLECELRDYLYLQNWGWTIFTKVIKKLYKLRELGLSIKATYRSRGIVVGPSIFGMQEYWVPGCIKIPHHSAGHTPQLCATIGTLFYVHNCRLSHYRLTMCWNSTLIPNSDLSSRRMQT